MQQSGSITLTKLRYGLQYILPVGERNVEMHISPGHLPAAEAFAVQSQLHFSGIREHRD